MPRSDIASGGLRETLVASAARAASGNSGAIGGFGYAKTLRVQLDVTAVAGATPTLDVVVEDTIDGVNFNTIGTFAQRTAVGRQVIDVTSPFSDIARIRWTIGGGTPSFTFSVDSYSE